MKIAEIDIPTQARNQPSEADEQLMPATRLLATAGIDQTEAAQLILELSLKACQEWTLDESSVIAIHQLLDELKPQTPIQGMLAGQLIATFLKGMTLMKPSSQKTVQPDRNLDLAIKFQRLHLAQIEAFHKLQGKGQQHIVTERISRTQ